MGWLTWHNTRGRDVDHDLTNPTDCSSDRYWKGFRKMLVILVSSIGSIKKVRNSWTQAVIMSAVSWSRNTLRLKRLYLSPRNSNSLNKTAPHLWRDWFKPCKVFRSLNNCPSPPHTLSPLDIYLFSKNATQESICNVTFAGFSFW